MDKRARRITILGALAAALFLGAVLGFGFSVISAHTQRENAEYMISYTMEEEPDSVVNTALSETFSDSRLNRMLLAPTFLEAFFIFKISSNSSPA